MWWFDKFLAKNFFFYHTENFEFSLRREFFIKIIQNAFFNLKFVFHLKFRQFFFKFKPKIFCKFNFIWQLNHFLNFSSPLFYFLWGLHGYWFNWKQLSFPLGSLSENVLAEILREDNSKNLKMVKIIDLFYLLKLAKNFKIIFKHSN